MKRGVVHLAFAALVLFAGGALEELLPKVLGVGFPVLLMAAVFLASPSHAVSDAMGTFASTAFRRSALGALLFTLAAGAFEDALSGLPTATSVVFFMLAGLAARVPGLTLPMLVLAYPVYEIWLWIWLPTLNGSVFNRFLLAFPLGTGAAAVTVGALLWLERKAAFRVGR